jgi:hypothetical protein
MARTKQTARIDAKKAQEIRDAIQAASLARIAEAKEREKKRKERQRKRKRKGRKKGKVAISRYLYVLGWKQ